MLFCDQINDYEDFKSRFGYKTGIDGRYLVNANGIKQRKNNIVYLFFKENAIYLHKVKKYNLHDAYLSALKFENPKDVFIKMLGTVFRTSIGDSCPVKSFGKYHLMNSGICVDGDVNSVRYQNVDTGKVYKMKIGKYVNKYLENLSANNTPFWLNNPTLRIFFIEELTELWKNKRLKDTTLHVVVDKDFHKIYDPSKRPEDNSHFDSCMDGDSNWNYYKDHKDIYDAVSLQDDEGLIYARAILVHCFDKEDNPHTYLERIYCNKRMYKDLLFEKAKVLGIFDLYKGLDASCHDSKEIYKVSDDHKFEHPVYINLSLTKGDYMSYQDTFKWYYPSLNRAYNYDYRFLDNKKYYSLATTEESIYLD